MYEDKIKSIPGISSLVQTPLLLSMIMFSFDELLKNETINVLRPDVYKAFSEKWFKQRQQEVASTKNTKYFDLSKDLKFEF